ncbi:hypothetical protein STCU_12109 [Strigomonas culicis]|uniref:Secreted protein n=1 Tax=Strigomonas culicis TaxID=28005 RepID=S9UXQ7_9TRYP|nr:hypothetical protein STCU_12109 [Strigomonas culicis]|eukprot:EPY15335.1 hypothetical protein STCU_12109 [Strigomonas culicis]
MLLALLFLFLVLFLWRRRGQVRRVQAYEIVHPDEESRSTPEMEESNGEKDEVVLDKPSFVSVAPVNHNPLCVEADAVTETFADDVTHRAPCSARKSARRQRSGHRATSTFANVDVEAMYDESTSMVE